MNAVLGHVVRQLNEVFDSIEPIRRHFAAIATEPGPVVREGLAVLQPEIFGLLNHHRRLIVGAGVITAAGLLADADHWLEWWLSPSSDAPVRLRVNLDPAAPDFYDYAEADWFAVPCRTAAPYVAGPYLDYACSNEYVLTLALPVTAGGAFAGVAAADVLVSRLEESVLPHLAALSPSSVLVNGDGRVVASAAPDYAPGLLAVGATSVDGQGAAGLALDWRVVDLA